MTLRCRRRPFPAPILSSHLHTNTEARKQLKDTAEDIGLSSNESGAGLLDVEAALGGSSGSNSSPSCTLVNPSDGDTVSGTVTVQVDASDSEDDDANLDVDVAIDGTWQSATCNSTSGYYEYDWDTTAVSDGDHTVQARATDSDGATTKSNQITVTVDNTADTAPTIDTFKLTNNSNPSWTRYDVDWAVSDADADLADVTSEMLDSSGSVVASESNAVGGSSASGTDSLRHKGSASEIRLTVTDSAGNTTSSTKSISSSGSGEQATDETTTTTTATTESGATGEDETPTTTATPTPTPTNANPTITTFKVTEQQTSNPHAEFAVDWTVSDDDRNLATVDLSLTQPDTDEPVDTATASISGSSASGTTHLQHQQADGNSSTYTVTLTVTDTAGAATSHSQQIQENGSGGGAAGGKSPSTTTSGTDTTTTNAALGESWLAVLGGVGMLVTESLAGMIDTGDEDS